MLLIILLVLFTVVMAVWFLALVGAFPASDRASGWLAFAACLLLGLVVFLAKTGVASLH